MRRVIRRKQCVSSVPHILSARHIHGARAARSRSFKLLQVTRCRILEGTPSSVRHMRGVSHALVFDSLVVALIHVTHVIGRESHFIELGRRVFSSPRRIVDIGPGDGLPVRHVQWGRVGSLGDWCWKGNDGWLQWVVWHPLVALGHEISLLSAHETIRHAVWNHAEVARIETDEAGIIGTSNMEVASVLLADIGIESRDWHCTRLFSGLHHDNRASKEFDKRSKQQHVDQLGAHF